MYDLSQSVDSTAVKSSLSADGVLTIAAPKKAPPEMKQVAVIPGDEKKK